MTTTTFAATAVSASDTAESAASIALGVGVIAALLAGVVLFIAGLISALRSRNYAPGGKAIWILLMLSFPFLGPLTWFIWGRKSTLMTPPTMAA